jgi:small subunit ribosomal protein S4
MLDEKQKLKACYGMLTEKQLVRYFKQAQQLKGNTPQLLAQMLESRLDIVVYRLKFAPTLFAAQQLVAHGHVQVNGRKVDIRSFQVRPGMTVSIREKSHGIKQIVDALESPNREVPGYLSRDPAKFTGQIATLPSFEEIPLPIEINLLEICDFLAHNH